MPVRRSLAGAAVAAFAISLLAPWMLFGSTLLTDTFGGALDTLLSAWTADSGNTWTKLSGELKLSGAGRVYQSDNADGFPVNSGYYASGTTFAANQTVTVTADFNRVTDTQSAIGPACYDSSGNGYSLFAGRSGGGSIASAWNLSKNAAGTSTVTTLSQSSTGLVTVGTAYKTTLTCSTNATTVSLTALVQSGCPASCSTVWSGSTTDTGYPTIDRVGVWGRISGQVIPDTATTGNQLGNLSAVITASISLSPSTVVQSSSGNSITITGTNTAWTAGTPGTPTLTASAGTITAQTVASATSATITYTAPSSGTSVTITDPSTGATATLTLTPSLTTVAVNDVGWYFSPATWLVSGSSYAKTVDAGAYTYFTATTTQFKLLLDTSALGGDALYIRSSIDGATFTETNISGLSTVTLASGLTSAQHTARVYFRGQTYNDRWTTPIDALKITGMQIDSGGTTAAPTVLSSTAVFFGDSFSEGADMLGTGQTASVQDATQTFWSHLAEALGVEYGQVGKSSQGWLAVGAGSVPTFHTVGTTTSQSWRWLWSGQARSFTGVRYIGVCLGANDYNNSVSDASVTASVADGLLQMRTVAPTATILGVLHPRGEPKGKTVAVTAGFAAYQAAHADANAYLIDPALPAWQAALITPGTAIIGAWSFDGSHPNTLAHAMIGARFVVQAQKALGVPRPGPVTAQ